MFLVRKGSSVLVHIEDVFDELGSPALLLGHCRKLVRSNPRLMLLIQKLFCSQFKKSIENAHVEHNKCRP